TSRGFLDEASSRRAGPSRLSERTRRHHASRINEHGPGKRDPLTDGTAGDGSGGSFGSRQPDRGRTGQRPGPGAGPRAAAAPPLAPAGGRRPAAGGHGGRHDV